MIDLRDQPASMAISAGVSRQRLKEVHSKVTFLPLPEFQPQRVRFRPRTQGAVAYDAGALRVSAFPGNVVYLTPSFLRQVTLFGRLSNYSGAPLSGARISLNDETYLVDDDGYFVLDAPATLSELSAKTRRGGLCVIPLPDLAADISEAFIDLGDLRCAAGEGPELRAEGVDEIAELVKGAAD